ncbi:MAG: hypothetical protein Q7U63_05775 [Polaromonas sp.]|uniref:hypothetical protein n=1 Tax=Polaromonas sp. TaxID=1869339 RepID=UPI00271B931F|nr:hypothetical protein [Polaromonas sp.]MDO9113288.1 hypothetical protein [Polaromonas sp.]MDP1889129.1 hypothetical protein [Polaromonas sp.]
MSWLASSLAIGLEGLRRLRSPVREARMDQVREAMLAALDKSGDDRFLGLKTRIRHAVDAQRMWDLRSELMKALASDQGEARAGEELRLITGMFRDILPKGLASGLAHHAGPGTDARGKGVSGRLHQPEITRSQF